MLLVDTGPKTCCYIYLLLKKCVLQLLKLVESSVPQIKAERILTSSLDSVVSSLDFRFYLFLQTLQTTAAITTTVNLQFEYFFVC